MDAYLVYWDILNSFSNYLRIRKKLRNTLFFISSIVIMAIPILYVIFKESVNTALAIASLIFSLIMLMIFLASALAFVDVEKLSKKDSVKAELDRLTEERIELKRKVENVESDSAKSVYNIIQLNLNQISEYYTINKSQARNSFRISVIALIVGSITILVGVYLGYFKDVKFISLVSVVAGIISELISGMYFLIYNKTLKQLNYFFNKLEKVQDTMLAIELSNSIGDNNKRLELIEKIVNKLIERSSI